MATQAQLRIRLDALNRQIELGDQGSSQAPDVTSKLKDRLAELDLQIANDLGTAEAEGTLRGMIDITRSFGGGANAGIANILGAPVDAVHFALRTGAGMFGVDVSDVVPFGGSESIRRGFNALGVRTEGVGETPGQRFAARLGEEVGASLLPFGAIGGAARAGAKGGILAKDIIAGFNRNPLKFAGGELAASAGGGAAAGAAEEAGVKNPIALTAAQIAGSVGPSAVIGSMRAAGGLVNRNLVAPFTQRVAEKEAAQVINRNVGNADRALRNLDLPRPGTANVEFTAAQLSNDPGLLALERAVTVSEGKVKGMFEDIRSRNNSALQAGLDDSLGGGADVGTEIAQQFVQGRVDKLVELTDRRVASAISLARGKVKALGVGATKEDQSRIVRAEIEEALTDARAQENQIWGKIYRDRDVGTQPLRTELENIRSRFRKADRGDNFPEDIAKLIEKKFGDTESVDEILALRSRILQDKRAENGNLAPNRKLLANLDDLQEAALTSLKGGRGRIRQGKAIDSALAYSRALNDRFTRGPVGKVLGYDTVGGKRVDDALTLEKLLTTGSIGQVNADALLAAVGGRVPARNAARQFLIEKFAERAVDETGIINAQAAKLFRRTHKAILERFPELNGDLADVFHSQKLVDSARRGNKRVRKGLGDIQKSRAALFLEREPDAAIQRVLQSSKKPTEAMTELVRQVSKDTSGRAKRGLQQGFFEYALRSVETKSLDEFGTPFVSAIKLRGFSKKYGALARKSGLYDAAEWKRFNEVVDAATIAERSSTSGSVSLKGSDTAQNFNLLATTAGRLIGAKVGSFFGSALVAAGVGGRLAGKVIRSLPQGRINDLVARAIADEDVMRTMLMKPVNDAADEIIVRRLRGHLANIQSEDDEDEQ